MSLTRLSCTYMRNTATIVTLLAIVGVLEYFFILYVYSSIIVPAPTSKISGMRIMTSYDNEEVVNEEVSNEEVYMWTSKVPPIDSDRLTTLQEPEHHVKAEFDNFPKGPEDNGPMKKGTEAEGTIQDGPTTALASRSSHHEDSKKQGAASDHPVNESLHTPKDKAVEYSIVLRKDVHSDKVQTSSKNAPEHIIAQRLPQAAPEHVVQDNINQPAAPKHVVQDNRNQPAAPKHAVQDNRDQPAAPKHVVQDNRDQPAAPEQNKVQRLPKATAEEATNKTCFEPPVLSEEVLVELDDTRPYKPLSPEEEQGGNIMFTLRTTASYHKKRLPILMETWMTTVDGRNIFVVTDGWDQETVDQLRKLDVKYVLAEGCSSDYVDLCCKAGVELKLIFEPGNEQYDWLCHIDDDMYVIMNSLIKTLSKFDPKTEPVYFGRSGKDWTEPKTVNNRTKLGCFGKGYHFALGGMYCLSRAMLEEARPYLIGGKNFANSCSNTLEPEDVTVGFIVGIILNRTLSRTQLINTHGLRLQYQVYPNDIKNQIAFSYGYGSCNWSDEPYNAVYIPGALFTFEEDASQFKSLMCYLHPKTPWCIPRKEEADRKRLEHARMRARARELQAQKHLKETHSEKKNIPEKKVVVHRSSNERTRHKVLSQQELSQQPEAAVTLDNL